MNKKLLEAYQEAFAEKTGTKLLTKSEAKTKQKQNKAKQEQNKTKQKNKI